MTSDRREIDVYVFRHIRGGEGSANTNQIDDQSLEGVVRCAERRALERADHEATDMAVANPVDPATPTTSWSPATLARTLEQSAALVAQVTAQATAKQLLSAGYLESFAMSAGAYRIDEYGRIDPWFGRMTQAQCSVTVRHPNGIGSGWAGHSNYDVSHIDEAAIAAHAMDKCLASLNPVRIEPGRYTTIFEPQAVADLVENLMAWKTWDRIQAEDQGRGSPFFWRHDPTVSRDLSRLGQRVMDARITISQDPSDPVLGTLPLPGAKPIIWVEKGILKTLTYDRNYALNELNEKALEVPRGAYRMSGGTTTIEGMIASTKRGLLVTRLSGLRELDHTSLLESGVTRDGLWLIENGTIKKAIRNFRLTDSPLFALNNVIELGIPVPVFHPFRRDFWPSYGIGSALSPIVVPPIKVKDFNFSSTIDAI
jgi:predicted Zn-dependent protease